MFKKLKLWVDMAYILFTEIFNLKNYHDEKEKNQQKKELQKTRK